MDEKEYLAQLGEIFKDDTLQNLWISIRDLWFLDSTLSLAWRHPELSDHQKNWMEHLHLQLEAVILASHPEAKELLKSGWDTTMDQPIDREKTEAINRHYRRMEKKYLRKTGRL